MERKKYYLTKEGLEKVKNELEELNRQKIALLDGSGPDSFRFGEIEAEFITFQEDLGNLKKRIAELEDVLENYEPIKAPLKKEQDSVHLGAEVTVEMDGTVEEFKIVGTIESDPANQKISDQSPIGRALLGKKVGNEVKVTTPMVNHGCRILKIKYGSN